MKTKNLKKLVSVTLFNRGLKKNSFFVLEVKNNKKIFQEDILYTKTFVKIVSKKIQASMLLAPLSLKFPLILKVFKDFHAVSTYLASSSQNKDNLVVFVKLANLSFKGSDTSLIFSSNPVYLFNSLSRLLNPTVNLLKLFNLSKN
jgi:hypothetical protein